MTCARRSTTTSTRRAPSQPSTTPPHRDAVCRLLLVCWEWFSNPSASVVTGGGSCHGRVPHPTLLVPRRAGAPPSPCHPPPVTTAQPGAPHLGFELGSI